MTVQERFRINAKAFFITWSQSGEFNLDILYNTLKDRKEIHYMGVGVEHHQDGNLHHHALIIYLQRFNLTNPRYFDFRNNQGVLAHPRIEVARSIRNCLDYIDKEDYIFREWGERPEPEQKIEDSNIYEMARKLTYEDFMNACRKEKIPYAYAQDAQMRKKMDLCTITENTPVEGTIMDPLDQFSYDFQSSLKTLVLVGPTGIGKTTWALRNLPKPILFVRCLETLKGFEPGHHKSILFDDMTFTNWTRDVQVYLVDRYHTSGISVKHGSVIMSSDTIRMFTNNEYPFSSLPELNRRIEKRTIKTILNGHFRIFDAANIEIPGEIPIVTAIRPEQMDPRLAETIQTPLADPAPVHTPTQRTPKKRPSSAPSPARNRKKRERQPEILRP